MPRFNEPRTTFQLQDCYSIACRLEGRTLTLDVVDDRDALHTVSLTIRDLQDARSPDQDRERIGLQLMAAADCLAALAYRVRHGD